MALCQEYTVVQNLSEKNYAYMLKASFKDVPTSIHYSDMSHFHVKMSRFPQYVRNEGVIIYIFTHFLFLLHLFIFTTLLLCHCHVNLQHRNTSKWFLVTQQHSLLHRSRIRNCGV